MLELDEDDNFGDLYTDLEVDAGRTLSELLLVRGGGEENSDSVEANEAEEGQEENGDGIQSESYGDSESEDDLNIVLNNDETEEDKCYFDSNVNVNANAEKTRVGVGRNGGGFDNEFTDEVVGMENDGGGGAKSGCNGGGVGGGGGYNAQYKLLRSHSHSTAFTNNVKSNVRGNWEDKSSGPSFGTCSIGTQIGRYISLPRYRTILDVNIDSLEWKPWRHPGADITDFFNFGLDEVSWKCYCNRLDKCRGKNAEVNGCSTYKPLRHTKQDEAASEHKLAETATEVNTLPQLKTLSPSCEVSPREQQAEMPRGEAIQVKEGIGERQPSADVRHFVEQDLDVRYFVERDLDVVIEVPVQDTEEDLPISAIGTVDGRSSFVQTASDTEESGDVAAHDGEDMLCLSSASDDELPSLEGSPEETKKSFPESCNPAYTESGETGNFEVSEADEHHQQEKPEDHSDGSPEVTRSSVDPQKRSSNVKSPTGPCVENLQSSDAVQILYSPNSSHSQSHDLTSRYGSFVEADKFHGHSERESLNSVSEMEVSVTFDYHSSKGSGSHGINMRRGYSELFSRSRNSIQRKNGFQQKKSSRMAELSYLDDRDTLYVSDSEKFHGSRHPTTGHLDQKNRQRSGDYSGREDILFYERSKRSFYCGGEKFCDYQSSSVRARNSHRRGCMDFRYEGDLPHRRITDGEHHFPGKRIQRSNGDLLEQNLDQFESRQSFEEMDCLHYDWPRQFIAGNSQYRDSRNCTRWKWKPEELHFHRRMESNNFMPECFNSNEYAGENRRCIQNDKRERDVITQEYDDGLLSYTQREVESPVRGKRKFYNPLNVYESESEDKKARLIGNNAPFLSYKRHHTVGRGRGPGPSLSRTDVFGTQIMPTKDKYLGRCSESKFYCWADVYHDNEIENPDHQDNFGRRKLYVESEGLWWSEDKYNSWCGDSDFQSGRTLNLPKRNCRSKRFDTKHDHGGKIVGYEFEDSRCKQLRKANNGSQFLQNSNFTRRDTVGRTLPGSWNSTDKHMVVGNRKSSRCFEGGSVTCDARYRSSDWNNHSGQRIFKDSHDSRPENIVRADNDRSSTGKDSTWKRNDSPEIEAQITTQETRSIAGSKNHSSENPRILEMMAKMEKRRERFEQPLGIISSEKNDKTCADEFTEIMKLQRPVRKRKWFAS